MAPDAVAKPRRLRYLRIVLSARIDETPEATDVDVDALESSEIVRVLVHGFEKPKRLRKATSETERGSGWRYKQEGKRGNVIFWHSSGTMVELMASSNGWFRVKNSRGEFVVFPGPSTSAQGMPKYDQRHSQAIPSSLKIAVEGWKIDGTRFASTQSNGVNCSLSPDGQVLYQGSPLQAP
jgi:hypothetical protein